METDATLRDALAGLVYVKIDAEKGGGVALAKQYHARGFPSFVLLDANGAVLDHWAGYGEVEPFLARLKTALADPTTLEAKTARFASSPSATRAESLADIHTAREDFDEALRYYREAQRLDPASAGRHASSIFEAQFLGWRRKKVDTPTLASAADAVLAAADATPAAKVSVARAMALAATREKNPSIVVPYIAPALAASEGTDDPDLASTRKELAILQALYVDHDKARAVELKRSAMEDGWLEDPDALNAFAWWCFENEANLEEAEALARKGVDLSAPGASRAQILDTVAEICHLRGKSAEAADLEARARREDPSEPLYPKQEQRFRAAAAGTVSTH